MKISVVVMLAILTAANLVLARPDNAHVLGEGAQTCATWSKMKSEPTLTPNTLQAWARGFASAFNFVVFADGDVMHGSDSSGMIFWIDGYCATHPTTTILAAVAEFLRTHDPDHPATLK